MSNITSKYNGEVTSVDKSMSHISSKTENGITSATPFRLDSKVMSAPGASDIVSSCWTICWIGRGMQSQPFSCCCWVMLG